ncbi:hypothetical protein J3A72_000464 [Stenotrophomonas sp. PvP093]|uniref:hypothetical protein n=1 Tax=unclassified Stenotrophomonas TaxID=196198 RepID=UPI001AE90C7D|nr:hypothetical protein [Stenotrophomonas sp. PvP093]MBP2480172.1 hypothetical protein [Stenotrophomonas sp. PvP093]
MSAADPQWFGLSVSQEPESNIVQTWVFEDHMQFVYAVQVAIANHVHLIEAHVYAQHPRAEISTSSDFHRWVSTREQVAERHE